LRTVELGEYWGYFDGPRLIAMAGERFIAGSMREISGVCTCPDHQGRGLARRLMLKLIHREMGRGETPFLHVMSHNTTARGLYERMGFREYKEVVVRVVSRL
jgi:predicted GNAT family acetyltransferase